MIDALDAAERAAVREAIGAALRGPDFAPFHNILSDLWPRPREEQAVRGFRYSAILAESYVKLWRRHFMLDAIQASGAPYFVRGDGLPGEAVDKAPDRFAPQAFGVMEQEIAQSTVSLSAVLPIPDLICDRVVFAARARSLPASNRSAMLDAHFREGEDYVALPFDETLADRLSHYAARPDEAARIGANARRRLRDGTWRAFVESGTLAQGLAPLLGLGPAIDMKQRQAPVPPDSLSGRAAGGGI